MLASLRELLAYAGVRAPFVLVGHSLSPRGEQVIAPHRGHFPQLTEPWLVLDALGKLVDRCGAGS